MKKIQKLKPHPSPLLLGEGIWKRAIWLFFSIEILWLNLYYKVVNKIEKKEGCMENIQEKETQEKESVHNLDWAKHVLLTRNDNSLQHCEDYYEALGIVMKSGEPYHFMI